MRRFGFHHFGRGRALGLVALIGSVVSLAVLGALPVEAGTRQRPRSPKRQARERRCSSQLTSDRASHRPPACIPRSPQPQTKECRCGPNWRRIGQHRSERPGPRLLSGPGFQKRGE